MFELAISASFEYLFYRSTAITILAIIPVPRVIWQVLYSIVCRLTSDERWRLTDYYIAKLLSPNIIFDSAVQLGSIYRFENESPNESLLSNYDDQKTSAHSSLTRV